MTKARRALAARAVERRFQKDELLFVAGEEARGLYMVVEGAVRAFRVSPDGREQVIHVERAGATVAEVPVFDDGAFPSTVAAETDSILLFIDKRDVRKLCLEHPQISLATLKVLAGRLRRCAELVETLTPALNKTDIGAWHRLSHIAIYRVRPNAIHGRKTS